VFHFLYNSTRIIIVNYFTSPKRKHIKFILAIKYLQSLYIDSSLLF